MFRFFKQNLVVHWYGPQVSLDDVSRSEQILLFILHTG